MAMSLKQKLHFGSKRVRAAARAAMKTKRKAKRASAHRRRTKPNPGRKRPAARKRVNRARRAAPKRRRAVRKNPGEIISLTLGNPAKRRKKAVAKTKRRRRKASSQRVNAGRRRTRRNPARRGGHRRRSNPGGYRVTDLFVLGGGAVVGASVPKLASQAVLGPKNTGVMGYLANLAATGILAWAANTFMPRQKMFAVGILAGGIGQVISRAISDNTPYGAALSSIGFGDYIAANFVTPQIVPDALNGVMSSNGQLPMASQSAGVNVGQLTGAPQWA